MELVPAPPPAPPSAPLTFKGRVKAFRARYEKYESIAFFAGGFLFDAVMVKRIDEPWMLGQQALYLVFAGGLLALTQRYTQLNLPPPPRLKKAWHYVDHVIHFMMGTLLNAYTIFYFQSASGLTALGFLLVIACLLAVNEMPRFHKLGPVVMYALYSVCLTSYFAYLFPVLLGHIRPWMFYLAVLLSLGPLALHVHWMLRWTKNRALVMRHVVAPALGVQAAFVLLYALHLAPPVPLAVKEMGIYHEVKKEAAGRRLYHQRPFWKFWQKGDQDFRERPGDHVWCFARVFAPKHFEDKIYAVWFFDDPKRGWRQVHRLGLSLTGSSERGFATEANLTMPDKGDWRVELQTEDGRTMGQLSFTVEGDSGSDERAFTEDFSPSA